MHKDSRAGRWDRGILLAELDGEGFGTCAPLG
jgi:hypothetical protein